MASLQFPDKPESGPGFSLPNGHAGLGRSEFSDRAHTVNVDVHQNILGADSACTLDSEQRVPKPETALTNNLTGDSDLKETLGSNTTSNDNDAEEIDPQGAGSGGDGNVGGGGRGKGARLKNRRSTSDTPRWYMPPITENPQNRNQGSHHILTAGSGPNTSTNITSANPLSSYSETYSTYDASFAGRGGRNAGGRNRGVGPGASGRSGLTVEGTWKADVEMKEKHSRKKSSVCLLVTVKWIVTAAIFAALLACLVAVKLSIIVLCSQLSESVPKDETNQAWRKYSAQFILIYLLLTIPPFLMLLRALWFGLLDRKVPWPHRRAVVAAVLSAALESGGLCLLCYSVLGASDLDGGGGRFKPPGAVLLLSSLLTVPAVNVFFIVKSLRRLGRVRTVTVVLVVVGVVCFAIGLVLVLVSSYHNTTIDHRIWHPIVAIVCLSVAWMPWLQRYISTSRKTRKTDGIETAQSYGTFSGNDNTASTTFNATTTTMSSTQDSAVTNTSTTTVGSSFTAAARGSASKKRSGDLSSNAAWRTSVIVNGCRVVFIFIFSFLLFTLDSGSSTAFTEDIHQAWLDAWDLSANVKSLVPFWVTLGAGPLAYILAFAACHTNMARGALAMPLLLATPLSLVALAANPVCEGLLPASMCSWEEPDTKYLVPAAVFLALGHLLAFGWSLFRVDSILLQQECVIFCVPGFNGVALDTWLTVIRRHDVSPRKTTEKKHPEKNKVFICTTMYREEEDEMRQLLESIRLINEAAVEGDRQFESHIFFDNGVRQKELSEFALALVGLLDDTLDVEPGGCTRSITPYGLKLSWGLPGPSGRRMPFNIHLKDNLLVKNKKRWSQVMYMSYVLDFLNYDEEDAFILTTDADVVFTPDSVEALLDLMTRDNSIGAVCARTHPMGGGPLVWYQIFEYAIGHWFQKAAEHVLGSVLCAPGCFSVYRCRALTDVLPKYAKRVESAFDFLTKDMGEDRWLCTLLVQSGWRIEYCAAAENRTNCPNQFEEFYKQRRRWIASTLANLMLIVQEYKYVLKLNHRVSILFLFYQGLLLFSTLIGPSTVMLVVSGGLSYAWTVDSIMTVVLQMLICVAYAGICIFTTQSTQLKVAKLYTFVYAVVMTAVVVGVAEQIADDLSAPDEPGPSTLPTNGTASTTTLAPNQHISVHLPVSVTTLYLAILIGIFLTAGLLHPREFYCLFHGLWYLLCLPSGYLVLTVYSICNITDSSWGTREQASEKSSVKKVPWQQRAQNLFYDIFFCCQRKETPDTKTDTGVQTVSVMQRSLSEDRSHSSSTPSDVVSAAAFTKETEPHEERVDDEIPDETEPVPVEEWLPLEMRGLYTDRFQKHGFDSTLFIAGMTETELRRIGVTSRGHLHYLLAQIALIPAFEIEYKVPTDVDGWLEEIGLPMYRDNFRRNHIRKPKEMEILKSFGRKEIERELGIVLDGHVKRLQYAIRMLRDPTEAQRKAIRMRQVIEGTPVHQLHDSNVEEYAFWDRLKQKCLEPDLKAFGHEGEVKVKLADLRNNWLMIIAVSNTLWLVLISTLASNTALNVYNANPLGLVFLVVFGFIFAIQFLAMLLHRLYTLSHFLARAPYRCRRPTSALPDSWERGMFEESVDRAAMAKFKEDAKSAWERVNRPKQKHRHGRTSNPGSEEHSTETTPLFGETSVLDSERQARVI